MSENRISATLTAADQQVVMTAINSIRQKLPFLIDLSPDERRSLPKMGDKSRAFVTQALDLATQNSDFLPRSFDVEEMRKDVELATALQSISASLTQLQELVEDSSVAVGSEAYMAALVVYNYAQSNGRGGALDNLLDAMGQRFARKNRQPVTPAPPTP